MLTVPFSYPFLSGGTTVLDTDIATGLYQVGIAGRGYMLDIESGQFRIESLDYMRNQQDTGGEAGEQTLSNLNLWRRTVRSWHLGAGQSRGDEEDSSPYRFDVSKGVDPWSKWKLSLLPDTTLVDTLASTPAGLVVVGTTLIAVAGTAVRKSTNGTTWSAVVTLASAPTTQPASDGSKVYVGCADGKIKSVTTGGTVADDWTLASTNVLAFAKGRLWAGAGTALYPLTPGGAVTALVTHPWAGWTWTAICEGPRAVYAAGVSGDKSQIYRIPFKSDGTGFDAAVIAASLPDGETVSALYSYLGYLMIGTSKGVRFAIPDATGDLTYGSLIPTSKPVRCFEAQDRYVWFGWTDYDTVSTGLGRVDLAGFTGEITPAYASDLMYAGQGDIVSAVTFGDKRYFLSAGDGVVGEDATPVASGTLTLSEWSYGLTDPKIATLVSLVHEALDGVVQVSLSVDGSSPGLVAESSVQGSNGPTEPFTIDPIRGIRFALTFTLSAGTGDGPVVTGATLASKPVPKRGKKFVLPIMVSDQLDLQNAFTYMGPEEEQAFLEGLVDDGAAVTLQIGSRNYQAFPVNFRYVPYRQSEGLDSWTGTFVLELDEVTI